MADWLRLRWGNVPKAFKNVSGIYADDSGNLKVRNPDGTSSTLAVSSGGGPGGESPIALTGPYTYNFDTAGFFDANDNGLEVATIPAGSLVRVIVCIISAFNGTAPEIDVSLSTAVDAGSSLLGVYDASSVPNGAAVGAFRDGQPLGASVSSVSVFGFAEAECKVYIGLYTSVGTPSAGQAKVYIETVAATAP